MQNNKILEINKLFVSYYKREILHGVSMGVSKGEIVGIIGPNGAGKSTLFKAIFGLIQARRGKVKGKIVFNGKDIAYSRPRDNFEAGIGYLLQGGEIFSNLSVEDNLVLGLNNTSIKEINIRKEFVYTIFPKLREIRKKRAGLLSGGEKQMLAIGIILMARPKLLLLDEPTASLSQDIGELISKAILKIGEEFDTSVLLIEQNIERTLRISDRIYTMRNGDIIDQGTPDFITKNQKVEKLFCLNNK